MKFGRDIHNASDGFGDPLRFHPAKYVFTYPVKCLIYCKYLPGRQTQQFVKAFMVPSRCMLKTVL